MNYEEYFKQQHAMEALQNVGSTVYLHYAVGIGIAVLATAIYIYTEYISE